MTATQPIATGRRRLTFTTRSLLVAVAVVAVLTAAFLALTRQVSAVRRVEALGGEILFDYEYRIYHPRGGPRKFPSDWQNAAFSTVTGVNFYGKPLSDSDLTTFVGIVGSDLPKVERLSIRRTQITDIRPLTEMKRLKWLDISGTRVVDVLPLKSMTTLDVLYMEAVRASASAIDELKDALTKCAIYHDG